LARAARRRLLFAIAGIAESVAGRGKGLMTRTPEPAALCRLINCYFTAARVTPSDAMSLFKLLSVEAISIAAAEATDEELARLKDAQRLSNWTSFIELKR
jgi:DNA-binding FadR family transcriptional regulator